jgi:hypothetical protein
VISKSRGRLANCRGRAWIKTLARLALLANLAVVYAWTGELDLAFATLEPLKGTPSFIGYGDLKCDSLWTPLRNDPRFDKLLAELAPRD